MQVGETSIINRTNLKKIGALAFIAALNGIFLHIQPLSSKLNRVTENRNIPGPFVMFVEWLHHTSTLFDNMLNKIHAMALASIKGTALQQAKVVLSTENEGACKTTTLHVHVSTRSSYVLY